MSTSENTYKMSTSETGEMMNTEQAAAASAGAAVSPETFPPEIIQNPCFTFIGDEAGVDKPVFASPPAEGSTGAELSQKKKKRERPSKDDLDTPMSAILPFNALNLTTDFFASAQGQIYSAAAQLGEGSATASKKPRGRPPGSRNKPKPVTFVAGSAVSRFTPRVINVKAGEDIGQKILSSAHDRRTICIISATGAVSTVELKKPSTSDAITKHEGWFEIVSLSGLFVWSEIGGESRWTGGLSLSLAADGWVLGGRVVGGLTAASPVQVVVGFVTAEGKEDSKSSKPFEVSPVPMKANPELVNGDNGQVSHGTPMAQANPELVNGDSGQASHGTPMAQANPELVNGDNGQASHGTPMTQANPDLVNGDNIQPSHGTPNESSQGLGSTRQSEEPTAMG